MYFDNFSNKNNGSRKNSYGRKVKNVEQEHLCINGTSNSVKFTQNKNKNAFAIELTCMKEEMARLRIKIDKMITETGSNNETNLNDTDSIELKTIERESISEIQIGHL